MYKGRRTRAKKRIIVRDKIDKEEMNAVIGELYVYHRLRLKAQSLRIRISNNTLATIASRLPRQYAGDEDDDQNKKDANRAKHMNDARKVWSQYKRGEVEEKFQSVIDTTWMFIDIADSTIAQYVELEKRYEKLMNDIVKKLPIWKEWGINVLGLGTVTLGMIIAETGNLSNYLGTCKEANVKLIKRMGIGVWFDGSGQGRLPEGVYKTDKQKKAAWIERGYCPRRRTIIYRVAESFCLQQKKDSSYCNIYKARKAYKKEKNPEWVYGKIEADAKKYMCRKLLCDMRQKWVELHPYYSNKENEQCADVKQAFAAS